jgi:uncharacterized protein (UPF0332 family)
MTEANRREHARRELAEATRVRAATRARADLGFWPDAASRAYYAACHAASAALFSLGLQARTHAGIRHLFSEHFVKPGRLPPTADATLAQLESWRQAADYGRAHDIDPATGAAQVAAAADLVAAIASCLRAAGVVP